MRERASAARRHILIMRRHIFCDIFKAVHSYKYDISTFVDIFCDLENFCRYKMLPR